MEDADDVRFRGRALSAGAHRLAEPTPPRGRAPGGHIELGRRGEAEAERHLVSEGYRILERRFRTRAGEIDFIAMEGETLVFVEVKTRSSLRYGMPCEGLGRRQRSRIAAAACLYLARGGSSEGSCRFDVVEVLDIPDVSPRIRLIRNAFEAS